MPAADVRGSVRARLVADGQVDDLEVEPRCTEEQVEVAERVEVAEVRAACGELFVVAATKDLGSAERVLHALAHDALEEPREDFVTDRVQKAHRAGFHVIDETRAVDELAPSLDAGAVELCEVLRANTEVAVEDHEQVVTGGSEARSHGVPLSLPRLRHEPNLALRMGVDLAHDLVTGSVRRPALDEDQLGSRTHLW